MEKKDPLWAVFWGVRTERKFRRHPHPTPHFIAENWAPGG